MRSTPIARRAAAQASGAVVTGRPVRCETSSTNSAPFSTPRRITSADIAMMIRSGLTVSTLARASSNRLSIWSSRARASSSEPIAGLVIWLWPLWQVTPGGGEQGKVMLHDGVR